MTEVITRSPLQTLSMASSQRPRRKSDRPVGDDEDVRPSKKQKMDDAGGAAPKQANGRKTAAAGKKGKAAYEEDADGFQFSRAKTKKAPNNPVPVPQQPGDNDQAPQDFKPQQGKRGRPKKASLQAPSEPETQKTPPKPRRRSARLSGDKEQADVGQQDAEQQGSTPPQEVRIAKTPGSADIRVEKKRGPTKIALPFADTPVITRNKEMRKISAEGRRRSSSGMRGRRASSLIDSGASNGETDSERETSSGAAAEVYVALPHSEVATADFYKHIHQDLSEPRRMKQLLIWCGTRALPERPTGTAEEVSAGLAARTIQEELLRDFSNKNDMSDWFNREDITPTALVKKPNPRNLQNAAKLQELEQEVKRLKAEKAAWDSVLGSLSASEQQFGPPLDTKASTPLQPGQIDGKLLGQPEQSSILADLSSHTNDIMTTKSRSKAATGPLEFKLDSFADGVHKLEKLKETGDETVDRILSRAATLLQERDGAASTSAGTEKVGVGDLLRSLSRAK